jgi:hypothetical protein
MGSDHDDEELGQVTIDGARRRRDAEQITERIPRWELWDDGIEPDEELPLAMD